MPRVDDASIDDVRRSADLVELVRGQVQLTRRGGRWWGRCPFHEERTPSFCLIPPENRTYYCHSRVTSRPSIVSASAGASHCTLRLRQRPMVATGLTMKP